MSIEKISRGSDPHEPEGSKRKMREVGDQYKRIERTGEVDPENRKKQKWESPNDSPMDLSKKTSSLGSTGSSAPSDPYNTFTSKTSNASQSRSNNSSNTPNSNPYNSQNSQNQSNGTSSNSSQPSSNEQTSSDKKKEASNEKKSHSIDDKHLPGTVIEGDELLLEPSERPHLRGLDTHATSRHGEPSERAAKKPDAHEAKADTKESDKKKHASELEHAPEVHQEKANEKMPNGSQMPTQEKKHVKADGQMDELGHKVPEKHKEDKKTTSPSDRASLSSDVGQKAPEPIQAPQAANVSGPASVAHGVSSQLSHPEVSRLFTQLVSHLTATAHKGVKEVTITLSSGVFKGSQIVITETSTALRNYNIQLLGATNEASSLFAAHASELMESFQSKPFPFKVNRIDPGHLIRRKEDIGKEDNNDDNQENP